MQVNQRIQFHSAELSTECMCESARLFSFIQGLWPQRERGEGGDRSVSRRDVRGES